MLHCLPDRVPNLVDGDLFFIKFKDVVIAGFSPDLGAGEAGLHHVGEQVRVPAKNVGAPLAKPEKVVFFS